MILRIQDDFIVTTLAQFFKHVDLDPMHIYKVKYRAYEYSDEKVGFLFVNSLHEMPKLFAFHMREPMPLSNVHRVKNFEKITAL